MYQLIRGFLTDYHREYGIGKEIIICPFVLYVLLRMTFIAFRNERICAIALHQSFSIRRWISSVKPTLENSIGNYHDEHGYENIRDCPD